MRLPIIVCVVGGINSGKTAFSKALQKHLAEKHQLTAHLLNEGVKSCSTTRINDFALDSALKSLKANIVIVNGLSLLEDQNVRSNVDFKIFLDSDSDERLAKFVEKWNDSGSTNIDEMLTRYFKYVKPSDIRISKSRKYADFCVNQNTNSDRMDLLGSMLSDLYSKSDFIPGVGNSRSRSRGGMAD